VTQHGYERSEPKWPLVNAGHAGSTKSMPAYWTAALKLPKRRRIVFSDGLMPAWVTPRALGPRLDCRSNLTGGAAHRIQRCSSCVWLGPPISGRFPHSGPMVVSSGYLAPFRPKWSRIAIIGTKSAGLPASCAISNGWST